MAGPEDTSKRPPELHLIGAMDTRSNYIEDMEAAGQRQLVASTVLPIDSGRDEQALLELGFTFGAEVDDLFREATLPEGWVRRGSDHAMWSYIDDDQGRERVAVFYKAAFYDRSAHMYVVRGVEL